MKSVRPLCHAAALAALLLTSAGTASADDGTHRIWKGLSGFGSPVFQWVESFWSYVTGTDAPDGSRTSVNKDGSELDLEGIIKTDPITPPPGGGCIDPSGNPITCPTNPKP